jgi:hypothetical protein
MASAGEQREGGRERNTAGPHRGFSAVNGSGRPGLPV